MHSYASNRNLVEATATKNTFVKYSLTSIPGKPQKTKHDGPVQRPKVADAYTKSGAPIDIHNHVCTGSLGLEDAWQKKCQFARNHGIYLHKFLPSFIPNFSKENDHRASRLKET